MKLDSTSGNPSSICVLLLSVNHRLEDDEGKDTVHIIMSRDHIFFCTFQSYYITSGSKRTVYITCFWSGHFIFRIVFQLKADFIITVVYWQVALWRIMQIIVTVPSSSQNLLADIMLDAAAAWDQRIHHLPLSDEYTCFHHRPLGSD